MFVLFYSISYENRNSKADLVEINGFYFLISLWNDGEGLNALVCMCDASFGWPRARLTIAHKLRSLDINCLAICARPNKKEIFLYFTFFCIWTRVTLWNIENRLALSPFSSCCFLITTVHWSHRYPYVKLV